MKRHSENLRFNRFKDYPATFFITKSLYPKRPALNTEARQIIVSALSFAVAKRRICLRAFVVMPDHWHALVGLINPWTLPRFMHAMMSHVGAKTSEFTDSYQTTWQDGYYDTRIRTAKQFGYVTSYIEQNPVAKGLVDKPEQWDTSSARRTDLVTEEWPWLFD